MANPNPAPRSREQDWNEKQIKQLEKLYPTTDNEVVAEKIGKSVAAVRSMAVRLRLKKSTRFWDKPEEDWLLKNWDHLSVQELCEKLSKTKWAVINKYRELKGLRQKAR